MPGTLHESPVAADRRADPNARGDEPRELLHHRVVIVGGGTAGIAVAAALRRALGPGDTAIIEPSDRHYYQPLWTLVGGGAARKESTERSEAALIPPDATWIRDAVTAFAPDANTLLTRDGKRVSYDFLVVAAGIQLDWDRIRGLPAALGRDGVCSNYSFQHVDKTWEFLRAFRGGTAIFTQPPNPIKCGGAPQKIMYLADDTFRKAGVRQETRILFASALPEIFHVPYYVPSLERVVARKGIECRFRHNLISIEAAARRATFENLDTGEQVTIPYDLIHVTPPQSAPDFLKQSPLADHNGWVEVDPATLQHPRYANIFALGDASSAPTSKTAAAIRAQAPVVVRNLAAAMAGHELPARYDGYTSCPLVTGYGRLVLAEFDYQKEPKETFPFDQRKERRSMYLLKKHVLPPYYWHGLLRGRLQRD